jgi:hypothetical protein
MQDPLEGVSPAGTIVTGVGHVRVATRFKPVLDAAVDSVRPRADSSLYVYGSVATGMAVVPDSDVDLLSVGLRTSDAEELAKVLSAQFSDRCRGVEVAVAQRSDFLGDNDQAYGNRVFLRHYCAHLVGPDLHSALPDFGADARAARGFNGDIAQHARRWQAELGHGCDPIALSRRVARKALLAVAGLVSVHDHTWTTDRKSAAVRWAEVEPSLADDLQTLLEWSRGSGTPDEQVLDRVLDGVVAEIVASFGATIGLWPPVSGA